MDDELRTRAVSALAHCVGVIEGFSLARHGERSGPGEWVYVVLRDLTNGDDRDDPLEPGDEQRLETYS